MKTYQLWDYDRDESAEREARSPDKAVETYALEVDDGAASTADIGAMDDSGQWVRFRVRYQRRVDVSLDRGRDVDDPRPSEEE